MQMRPVSISAVPLFVAVNMFTTWIMGEDDDELDNWTAPMLHAHQFSMQSLNVNSLFCRRIIIMFRTFTPSPNIFIQLNYFPSA